MPSSKDYSFSDYAIAMRAEVKPVFYTPASLLEKGMCLCSDCGKMVCIDNRFCKSCRTEILILKEK